MFHGDTSIARYFSGYLRQDSAWNLDEDVLEKPYADSGPQAALLQMQVRRPDVSVARRGFVARASAWLAMGVATILCFSWLSQRMEVQA